MKRGANIEPNLPSSARVPRRQSLGKNDYVPEIAQRREVYRSQQNLQGPVKTWNTHTEDFTPKHVKYAPKWGRVMLYAYLTPGVVEFDDVVVKKIVPAVAGPQPKVRRHSLETKITTKEMEENEPAAGKQRTRVILSASEGSRRKSAGDSSLR